jgi:hypothetical protein
MSASSHGVKRLVRLYPRSWRVRYGDELETLILDMTGGDGPSWRVRADVARSAGRERLRAARLGDGAPEARVRGGTLLVLWGWTLFVLGGAIVAKSSEHWQAAMPGGGHALASAAFAGLTALAVVAGVLVLAGIAASIPSVAAFLRAGRWPQVRGRLLTALGATVVLIVATTALVAWAHGLDARARNGHDTAYGVAFAGWALLGAACLLTWTGAAADLARRLDLRAETLRAQSRLATSVAVAMGAMSCAMAIWWASVGHAAPAALTGTPGDVRASALVAQLVLAGALMLAATAMGALGARRAAHALPALVRGEHRQAG